MPHFSSPLKTFAQEEPVALAWRDSAPQSRCTPLALASSLALLSYTLLLLCRVSAGWQVPTPLSNAAHTALAMAGPCLGPGWRECGVSLVAVSVPAPTLAQHVPQRPGHCRFFLGSSLIPSSLPLLTLP